jgi:regulation of enolase protein 1 (concanavalin A-like superfamily)
MAADPKPLQVIDGWGVAFDSDGGSAVRKEGETLRIDVPGAYRDLWPVRGKTNAPRVLQHVEGDFTVTAKVSGEVLAEQGTGIARSGTSSAYRAGTLLIWHDANNFVRLDRGCVARDGKTTFTAYYHVFKDGNRVTELSRIVKDQPTSLRLARRGTRIEAAFSQNEGRSWTSFPPQTLDLPARVKVGVAALNATNKPFSAEFERLAVSLTSQQK